MKTKSAFAGVVYWIATVGAVATLTTHVAQWNRMEKDSAKTVQTASSVSKAGDVKLSAPYRDGVYMAKLAVARGEQKEPSVGRWSTEEQRNAFAAGFDRGTRMTAEVILGR